MSIVKMSLSEMKKHKISAEELARIDAINDEAIDCSDIPELTPEELSQFRPAREFQPAWYQKIHGKKAKQKKSIRIKIDCDVLSKLKAQGKDYKEQINTILQNSVLH